jgi:hypothetical protein
MDFHVIEGKVHISVEDSESIKKAIEEDVSFLCSQGLIDYSLILLKIDYEKYIKECKQEGGGLRMYKSTKE